jgi:hypothetical protein
MSFEVAIHCVSSSTENEEGTNLEGDDSRRQRTALAKISGYKGQSHVKSRLRSRDPKEHTGLEVMADGSSRGLCAIIQFFSLTLTMTNVLHHHIDFQPRPVSHAPSPFGFGFGLGSAPSLNPVASSSWGTPSTPGHTNVAAFQQLASSINQSAMRSSKRRHDSDEEYEHQSRDESMDRSPTPERPKRAAPKRARMVPTNSATDKENPGSSENKSNASQSQDEVDVGVLLGSSPFPS